MSLQTTVNPSLELLNQLFTTATREATATMCRWTNGLITLSLDEVCELPLEAVLEELRLGDELLTMVVLTMPGDIGGDMILCFDEVNGRELAAALLHRPVNTAPEWSELEQSALTETGNILSCAYLNALTRVLGVELVPSPPYFIQDYAASVIEQALIAQAEQSDQVLVCRTRFHREGKQLDWSVLFMPTVGLRKTIERIVQ
jgi:chemotaxis protein CheC